MQRHSALAVALVLLVGLVARADLSTPPVGPPKKLLDGREPIDVSVGHATPYVIDWDRDGTLDLLVGQFDGGKLRIYLNHGSNVAPEFSGFAFLQAGGTDASIPVT